MQEFFRKIFEYLKRRGAVFTSIIFTIIVTLFSVGMTVLIHKVFESEVTVISFIIAILVPFIIAPVFTFFILGLTFKLDDAQIQMRTLSITDDLTKAFNRRYFSEIAEQECARTMRYDVEFSIILFDIDGFKHINDTLGHYAGDRVLQETSRICKESIRGTDVFARWGGDEFIILVRESRKVDLKTMIKRIQRNLEEITLNIEGTEIRITVSVGAQRSSKHCDNFNLIVSNADKALYEAKEQGGNCFVIGEEEQNQDK